MQNQKDPFYEKLPFTLPQENSKPEFVIFGTGLQECLIAAYLSKMENKKGLIIDVQKTYGSCLKTVTIKQLHSLSINNQKQKLYKFQTPESWIQKNKSFFNRIIEANQYRGYNIDIEPSYFFGSSHTCQLLKEAEMDKYMDFRLVYNMLVIQNNKFEQVPLSKSKIFETKTLKLLQKKLLLTTFHNIIKIFNKYNKLEQDQNSTNEFDKDFSSVDEKLYNEFINNLDKNFQPILAAVTKNNKKIMNYLTYIICNYQYNYTKQVPNHVKDEYTVKGFLQRFGKFIKSCGIYGQAPYLYVDNGIGDIPQAYSRIASIYGSIFILHPKIQIKSIKQSQNLINIESNLFPERSIQTPKIYYGPTFYNEDLKQNFISEYILRVLLICQKIGNQEDCPSLAYLLDQQGFQNPIYLFIFDNNSHSVPKDHILYQFETIIKQQKESYEKQIQFLIDKLTTVRGEQFKNKINYASSYVRERIYPMKQLQNSKQTYLRDTSGIDLDDHFIHFKKVVNSTGPFFKKQTQNKNNEDEQYYDDTLGLLEKLNQIKIPAEGQQQNVKDQTLNMQKDSVQKFQEKQNMQQAQIQQNDQQKKDSQNVIQDKLKQQQIIDNIPKNTQQISPD